MKLSAKLITTLLYVSLGARSAQRASPFARRRTP